MRAAEVGILCAGQLGKVDQLRSGSSCCCCRVESEMVTEEEGSHSFNHSVDKRRNGSYKVTTGGTTSKSTS
jgi:hypothetical protein